jgi:hypothetical protein
MCTLPVGLPLARSAVTKCFQRDTTVPVYRVVKDTFLKYLNTKYKILSRNVFEILLSNTSAKTAKIQNTKYLFVIVFEIQNTHVT